MEAAVQGTEIPTGARERVPMAFDGVRLSSHIWYMPKARVSVVTKPTFKRPGLASAVLNSRDI